MLYANAGIDYWSAVRDDPYVLENPPAEIEPIPSRGLCKSLLLMAINAGNEKEAFKAFRQNAPNGSMEKRLSDVYLGQVLDLLRKKPHAIADRFDQ